jgi:flagellar basal-body rod protein FlgC
MSNLPIFDIAGSALQAQSVRMSTIASNLSNVDTVAGSAEAVYKPLEPIFQAVTSKDDPNITSVQVKEITRSEAAPIKRYEPGHPLADADGYIYQPDVDPVAQMVAQMAQMSTVQGITDLNTTVQGFQQSMASDQVLRGAALVGHQVLVPSEKLVLENEGSVEGTVAAPGAGIITVDITDANGAKVTSISVEA